MKERIEQILHKYKITSAQFADVIGVQRSSISHILSGRNKPSFDFIQKILLKYPEIDADWLITGRGAIEVDAIKQHNPEKPDTAQDLFTSHPVNQQNKGYNTEIQYQQETLRNEEKTKGKTKEEAVVTNVNSIKSIIILYSDNTFEVLNSR